MILHYLKNGLRYLARHLSFSLINILGLSIGIASCLLIFLYVHFELTYDHYNTHFDRIVRVTTVLHSPESDISLAYSPTPLAGELLRNCPELRSAARLEPTSMNVRKGGDVLDEPDFFYSEPRIFEVFSFSFLEGSPAGALATPHSIVLTGSLAKRYFGNSPALGRRMTCNGQDWQVSAVVADRPFNSDIRIAALMAKDFSAATQWMVEDFSVYTFLLFRDKPDLRHLSGQLSSLAAGPIQAELDREEAGSYHVRFEQEALADLHFSKGKLEDTPKGSREFNAVFSALAIFILIIALLNYINLSTAKATERAREVGVRKVIGARPRQLIGQFLGESFFLMALAWLIAIGLAAAGIPFLNRILSTHLSLAGGQGLVFGIMLFPLTALLAGIYPALVLSRFAPLKALKGRPVTERNGVGLRRGLTIVQFIIALAMLTGTAVIYSQMRFVDHKDLGADRSQIAHLGLPTDSSGRKQVKAFCQALRQESGIKAISIGSGLPVEGVSMSSTTAYTGKRKKEFLCNYFFIDPQFLPLLHISLAEGRNFSDSFGTDKKEAFLVNEAFAQSMGWKTGSGFSPEGALGQPVEGSGVKGRVVGVLKNFFFKSLHNTIEPAVFIYKTDHPAAALVKADPGEIPRISALWKTHFPSLPFSYSFMDDTFKAQYASDRMTLFLFNVFTGLAVFISCLGLYGLVSLMADQRTKEIGIRKVLGASLSQLVTLFAGDMIRLVVFAAVIAFPLAAMAMQRWLSSYVYRTALNGWMFVLPVTTILLLALAVTSARIIRTALINPVKSLRAE